MVDHDATNEADREHRCMWKLNDVTMQSFLTKYIPGGRESVVTILEYYQRTGEGNVNTAKLGNGEVIIFLLMCFLSPP